MERERRWPGLGASWLGLGARLHGAPLAFLLLIFLAAGCGAPPIPQTVPETASLPSLIDDIHERTFRFFWDTADPKTRLVPDRWPTKSFSSVAAVGFGLTAYPIGAERGWVTREEARLRVLETLRFMEKAPQGSAPRGMTGHKGFFYHFLDMQTGERFETVELSSIDTSLFLAGALFCQSYFDGNHPEEKEIREIADRLYRRVDWSFFLVRPPLVSHAWWPEKGFNTWDWRGYDESMILYILALGSPTHPIDPAAWPEYTRTYAWGDFQGFEHVAFEPLFGHQYSHTWIDFRGIRDAYMEAKGIDYFENTRRAAYSQRAYAIKNPQGWKGHGENVWGLTASDGPVDGDFTIDGRKRTFHTYWARGAGLREVRDDGTIAPTAAAASLPFAPEIVIPAIETMHARWGKDLVGKYGFVDAFNPTFTLQDVKLHHGRVVPGVGWFDTDYLGIDQGPIVAMLENHRSGLVWETMKKNPYIVRGLKRAGFTGGWLEEAAR
jgi:hypothetical protein